MLSLFSNLRLGRSNPARNLYCPKCASDKTSLSTANTGEKAPSRAKTVTAYLFVLIGVGILVDGILAATSLGAHLPEICQFGPVGGKGDPMALLMFGPFGVIFLWVGLKNVGEIRRYVRTTQYVCADCGHLWEIGESSR